MPIASSSTTTTRMRSLLRSASNPMPSTATAEQMMGQIAPPEMTDEPVPRPRPSPVAYTRLIARQDWDAVREALSTDEGRLHARSEMETSPDVDGGALHFACRFHPPLDVVMSLAELLPASVHHSDNMGRYPLHVASKWGASPRVVKFLLQVFPDAAGFQDAMGKTPLHLCCESYASKYSSRKADGQPLKEAMVEVVRRICRAAPDAVNLEDMEDMTALEYAIEAEGVELKVVRSIQKACERDWKHRRESPGASHETVRRSLLEQSQQNSQRLQTDLMEMEHVRQQASRRNLMEMQQQVRQQASGRNLMEMQQQVRQQASGRNLMEMQVRQASGRNLRPGADLNDATAAAMNMSLSKLTVDDVKGAGTRQPAGLQHLPRKKPSTRALMA